MHNVSTERENSPGLRHTGCGRHRTWGDAAHGRRGFEVWTVIGTTEGEPFRIHRRPVGRIAEPDHFSPCVFCFFFSFSLILRRTGEKVLCVLLLARFLSEKTEHMVADTFLREREN